MSNVNATFYNVNATFLNADQDWQTETTRYWFTLTGTDYGTGVEFDSDEFAVAESGGDSLILDADGCPITPGDALEIAVRKAAIVDDAMRAEASGL